MKIRKIVDICKKRKQVILFGEGEQQFLSDGVALYLLYDIPNFNRDTFCTTFDIAEDKADKILFKNEKKLPAMFNIDDVDLNETQIERIGNMTILAAGNKLVPYSSSEGIVFFDKMYLEPLDNDNGYEIYERTTEDGRKYYVVKTGFLLNATIMPMNVISEGFTKQLSTLAHECEKTLRAKEGLQCLSEL